MPTAQALALGATAGRLAGSQFVGRGALDIDAEVFLFQGGSAALAVVWARGESPAPRWLVLDPQEVRVLSYFGGRRVEIPRRPTEYVAPVDEDPVVVVAEGMTADELARLLSEAPVRDRPPGWYR